MPRVPTYDSLQVGANTLPTSRVTSPNAPEGGQNLKDLGQGAMRAGSALQDFAQQADQARVNAAMNKLVEAKLKLTYDQPDEADPSKPVGFVHLRGEAALNRPDKKALDDEYIELLNKQADGIADELGNDRQKAMFKQNAAKLATQFRGSLVQHAAQEFGQYQMSVQKGTIDTATQQMALAWGDPEAVRQSTNAIKSAVVEAGKLQGLSGQQVEANLVEALSPGHVSVIASAIDAGKIGYANEYMKQVEGQLTPEARLQMKKTLEAGEFESRTQGAADQLFAKHNGDMTAALAEVRSTMSGKDEDAVVSRLKTMDAERIALRERAQKEAADSAWQYVAQGKVPPTSLMTALDGRDALAIQKTLQEGPTKTTDPNVYYALTIAASSDPNFKNEDLRRYADKLTPGDFKHFADLQGKQQKPEELDQVVTIQSQKDTMADTLGLKKEERGLFYMQADKALMAAQREKGKALTQDERQLVLDRLALKGTTPGALWGSNDTRAFKAQAEGKQFTPEWSEVDVRKATAALQRKGIKNPTKDQIEMTLKAVYGQ